MHFEPAVHDRQGVASHLRCAGLMPERSQTIANEALQIRLVEVPGRCLALRVGPKSRRVADLAGLTYPDH